MKKKWVLMVLGMILSYSLHLVAMDEASKIPLKDRVALQRGASAELLRRSNESLRCSDEIKKQGTNKSSTEIFRAAMVKNYAGFPHSSTIPEESHNSLADSNPSRGFTESFYDIPYRQ